MNDIKEEILNHLRYLSPANLDFFEFINNYPQALNRSSYNDLIQFSNLISLQPWPTFIDHKLKKKLQEASTSLFSLIKQVPQRLFSNNSQALSDYFGYSEDLVRLQLETIKDGHLDNLLGRGDFIMSYTGLKCLEYNIAGTLGGFEIPQMEATYLNNPIIAKFIDQYHLRICNTNQHVVLLRHLLTAIKKKFPPGECQEINIAIVTPEFNANIYMGKSGEYLNQIYHQVLAEQDYLIKGTVLICDFQHLTIKGDCVFYKEKQIHILIDFYHGNIPSPILLVSLLGNVFLYNGPITPLLSNKLNLALLSENENSRLFNAQEKEWIKTYIPWTRRIVPGKITFGAFTAPIEDFLNTQREKLVIKPVGELGGKDVQVGKYTAENKWEEIVTRVLDDETRNWIIQEYIEPASHLYQYGDRGYAEHHVIWGLFVFGVTYAGGFLRVLPSHNTNGVINSHMGANEAAIFEVEN